MRATANEGYDSQTANELFHELEINRNLPITIKTFAEVIVEA
jgi:hypothetical protein